MYTHRQHHVYYVFITNHFLHKDGEKQKGRPEKRGKKQSRSWSNKFRSSDFPQWKSKCTSVSLFHGSNLGRVWVGGEEPGTCPLPHRTHRGEGQWGNLDLLSLWYPGVGRRDNVTTSLSDKTAWQCLVIQFSPCHRTNNPHLDCIAMWLYEQHCGKV